MYIIRPGPGWFRQKLLILDHSQQAMAAIPPACTGGRSQCFCSTPSCAVNAILSFRFGMYNLPWYFLHCRVHGLALDEDITSLVDRVQQCGGDLTRPLARTGNVADHPTAVVEIPKQGERTVHLCTQSWTVKLCCHWSF